jgi:hypothetical protein
VISCPNDKDLAVEKAPPQNSLKKPLAEQLKYIRTFQLDIIYAGFID